MPGFQGQTLYEGAVQIWGHPDRQDAQPGLLPIRKCRYAPPLVGALRRLLWRPNVDAIALPTLQPILRTVLIVLYFQNKLNESLNNRERKMDKKQTPTDKASKEDTLKVEKVKDTNNGQVPVRGSEASDEEVLSHYHESVKRNHRLMELLAR